MKPGCTDRCRFKCSLKLSESERKNVFESFWKIGEKVRMWDTISQWVKSGEPKEVVCNSDTETKDSTNRKKKVHTFHLPTEKGLVKVCKTMFLNTLG